MGVPRLDSSCVLFLCLCVRSGLLPTNTGMKLTQLTQCSANNTDIAFQAFETVMGVRSTMRLIYIYIYNIPHIYTYIYNLLTYTYMYKNTKQPRKT